MKKIFLVLISFGICSFHIYSQDTMYLYKNGHVISSFAINNIDSVTFYKASGTKNSSISGLVQKGPFVSGSSVTIFDLLSNLSQSGKSFTSQIKDNKGTFTVNDILLSSDFVSLRADGFYFNEILGKQSNSQITLNALSNISGNSEVNINLLTHLEKARVEYLMKNGMSFASSKIQAQKEILSIFNIQKVDSISSENLNISKKGDDNAILLALSCILQAYRSEGELTELMSNISLDIEEDGILTNDTVGSALVSQAIYLDTATIKTNLINRYSSIGASAIIPDFGKYITHFILNTKFIANQPLITYPETGANGENILLFSKTNYKPEYYANSLAAYLPSGTSLKIRISALSADTTITPPTDSTGTSISVTKPNWYYDFMSNKNWIISNFDMTNYIQTFTAAESGKSCDLWISFQKGTFLIEYFEMNAVAPNRKKTIVCK